MNHEWDFRIGRYQFNVTTNRCSGLGIWRLDDGGLVIDVFILGICIYAWNWRK